MPPRTTILGIRVDAVTWPQIEEICRRYLRQTTARQIVTVNGEFILAAPKDQVFRDIINNADLVIPDSTNVVWASRLTSKVLPAITPGSDLVEHLANLALEQGEGIFLLGAQPNVAKRAGEALVAKHPKLVISGNSAADPDDPTIVGTIRKSHASIVLVAYGQGKQEKWIAKNMHQTGAKILVGVGGTFDMLAGNLRRSPKWLRQLHLEWLWRLILQPSRWKRIWQALIIFPLQVLLNNHRKQ